MTGRQHGPFRYMGDFKAIALDYEFWLSNTTDSALYCLNQRDIYVLLALCEYVGWWTRWYNTDDTSRAEIQALQSELMEKLMNCVDISVLVEQGKLNLSRTVQQQQIESQGLRDRYQDEYTGDPTSINPDAPTSDFGSTGDRYDALCAGLMAFVYQFANWQIQALVAGDVAAFALLAGAALLLIPGLNLFYIAGASLALIAGGGIIGVSTGTAVAALQDKTALNNVVCFMRDTLKAQSVTEANFAACLDSYPWSTGSHEAIIADFIKPTLGTNYLGFLDMLGQGYAGTLAGNPLPDCPCDDGWEKVWDLSLGAGGWTINRGGYVSGTGIQSLGSGPNPYTADISRAITWPGGSALTAIEIEATSTTGDAGAFRGVYYPGSGYSNDTCCETMTGDYTMTFDPVSGPVPGTTSVQVSNNTIPGTNTIRSVTFRGTGPEPTW